MSSRSFKQRYRIEIITLILFAVFIGMGNIFSIPCLFRTVTGIPCPTCNMTRALLALLRGDIHSYLENNAMALPVALVFVGELFNGIWGRNKKYLHIITVIVLLINIIYYANRIGIFNLS